MRALILFLAIVPAVVTAEPYRVQVIHAKRIDPLPAVSEALEILRAGGVEVELVRIVRRRLPRLSGTRTEPINQFWPLFRRFNRPGVRTLFIASPKIDDFGRPILSGVATVCFNLAIVGYAIPSHVPSTIAHELGHAFGATHQPGPNVMNPAPDRFRELLEESVREMAECEARGTTYKAPEVSR